MKAAVLHELGTLPKYDDFNAPTPQNDNELLITIKAASIKQLDRMKAAGRHYISYPSIPVTVGIDGAGILENGTRIYAWGKTGMIAEKALVTKNQWTVLPDNIDYETAAVLPNALLGSDAALLYRGNIQPAYTVLINGATGVTGKIAVQMAKHRGAAKVIATGRNEEILEQLKLIGADEVINLSNNEKDISVQLEQICKSTPIDIVLDYLWGSPLETIIKVIGKMPPHKTKIITVGQMAGANINLPSSILRSTQIEMLGSGIGSISPQELNNYMQKELPEAFHLAAEGRLTIDFEIVQLKDIEKTWGEKEPPGSRFVVKI
ncbi:quinone oxidoreductase family protein [Flavobacterium sp. C4GT6]|uniref:quinone oxidoreductase family protein n=1 Tax=Flavobacterium sp. C4GT6 TaxID=3103818 RepID=UPI002ED675DD